MLYTLKNLVVVVTAAWRTIAGKGLIDFSTDHLAIGCEWDYYVPLAEVNEPL